MTFRGFYRGAYFTEFLKVADDIIDVEQHGALIYYCFSDYLVIVDSDDKIRAFIFRVWDSIETGDPYSLVAFRYPGGTYERLTGDSCVLKYKDTWGRSAWVYFVENQVSLIVIL